MNKITVKSSMNKKLDESHLFLINYAYAFLTINKVDTLLEFLLLQNGKLENVPQTIREKLLEGATMGKKFSLAKDLIESRKLRKKICKLIEQRNIIAHKNFIIEYNENGEAIEFNVDGKKLIKDQFMPKLTSLGCEVAEELIKILRK